MTLKKGPWIWSLSFLLVSPAAFCLNLHYVSPSARMEIQKEFSESHAQVPTQIEGTWMCDMVGMKTGLQHEKNLPLYQFTPKSSSTYENRGAAPNSLYTLTNDQKELKSTGQKVTEILHFRSENTLLVQMTRAESNEVVALARCQRQSASLL